jgi:tRNA(adenine34) deaminase
VRLTRPAGRGDYPRVADWHQLRHPWPDVFSLMWDAYVAGTIPVGAVVVDERGDVVSRGRNRIFDDRRDGHLGRSRLAHAELNALSALTSARTYEDFTLYTALEPCHLCLSAAISVRIGTVRYAAHDPYGGAVGKLVPSRDHEAHPIDVEGPMVGPLGRLPELLHVAHFLWRKPEGDVASFYRRSYPDVVAAAKRMPAPDYGATLDDALASLPT